MTPSEIIALLSVLLGIETLAIGFCLYWLIEDREIMKALEARGDFYKIVGSKNRGPSAFMEYLKSTENPTIEGWVDFQDGETRIQ